MVLNNQQRRIPHTFRLSHPMYDPAPACMQNILKAIFISLCKHENDYNATMTRAARLEEMVIIPGEKSYFETGMPNSSCEAVCSQGALLLGGLERHRAVAVAACVLKPEGRMFSRTSCAQTTPP